MKREFKDADTNKKILPGEQVKLVFDFPDEKQLNRVGRFDKFLKELLERNNGKLTNM